ncbi:MAG: hypothetical protein HC779_06455, partial [Phyllobacteriaceae bacterium]|nr:hypothetical protein [Phyllobacteriaceae bacterium]
MAGHDRTSGQNGVQSVRKSAETAFTLNGYHMLAIFVAFFGVIVAVNLTMARFAVTHWTGLVVKNSYVASQNYNGWLRQAAASKALGWQAVPHRRDDGRVVVAEMPMSVSRGVFGPYHG